jgi:hypothetical protein
VLTLLIPIVLAAGPLVTFPTIVALAGATPVNCIQEREAVADLFVTLAVSVTPLFSVKMPEPALLIRSQVVLAVMVIV